LIPTLFFVLVFQNDLEYRHLHARINSGDDLATLYTNLVNFVQ